MTSAQWQHTTDLSDGFFSGLVAMCGRLKCSAVDMLSVLMSESGCDASAHNPGGATGLNQNTDLKRVGFKGTWQEYAALTAEAQLLYVEKYFAPYAGRMPNAAAVYVANFLPAFLSHATEPGYVLCGQRGPLAWAWQDNRALDHGNKGAITVQDMTTAAANASHGARWDEMMNRLSLEMGTDVVPSNSGPAAYDEGDDSPDPSGHAA